jgi:hypothetical protein
VCRVSSYGLGDPGSGISVFLHHVHVGSKNQPTSYIMGTGGFLPEGKAKVTYYMKLTSLINLVQNSRTRGVIIPVLL